MIAGQLRRQGRDPPGGAGLARDCALGRWIADQMDEALFASYLDTADMPDPDL